MKPVFLVVGAAWTLSLGAAFLLGHGSTASEPSASGDASLRAGARSSAPGKSARAGSRLAERGHPGRIAAGSGAASIVTSRPPRQAVVELAQLNDPMERAKGFLALIDTLGPDDFRDVVADFRAIGITEQRKSEYGMLLHAWGQTDPTAALAYAMKNTGTPFARQTILASWAADDPEAAIAYAKQNHKGEAANPLLVGVIRGVAPHDLSRATELLQDLPYSRERGEALQTMLPFVMQDGIEVALNWSAGIADGRLKTGAVTYIMSDLTQSQPEVAAEVLGGLEDSSAAVRVADDVGGALARISLERAVRWSEGLQPDLRAEAMEGIVPHYAAEDPQAASQWLESLSGTTNLDAAIRSFALTAQHQEPQMAADWIARISDEGSRAETYRGVLSRWWGKDAAAAEAWIQSAPNIPDSIRALPESLKQGAQPDVQGGRQFRFTR